MATLTVGPIEYYYREAGSGPLVVLAASDGSSSAQWRGLMESLAGEFHLRAFDTSGMGRSGPWPAGVPFQVAAESMVVDALAAGTDEPIHLVGHSFGGTFLLEAAMRLGSRVASLTLFEPILFFLLRLPGHEAAWQDAAAWGEKLGPMVAAGQTEAAAEMFITYWNGAGSWSRMPQEARVAIVRCTPKIGMQWEAVTALRHTLADYAAVATPTLILRGSETTLSARTMAEILAGALPHVELAEIPGAGHMGPISHADAVNARIAAHLRAHRGR